MNSPHRWKLGGAALAFAATMSGGMAADADPRYHAEVMNALRGALPKYDAKDSVSSQTAPTVANSAKPADPAPLSPATPPSPDQKLVPGSPIEMPKVVIHPFPSSPAAVVRPLPRIPIREPFKNVQVDDFTSPAERDKRLVEKHLSSFDRNFLNSKTLPLVGVPNEVRARAIERIEQSDAAMNHFADIIDLSEQTGSEIEEDRKLRKDYLEMMRTRPR